MKCLNFRWKSRTGFFRVLQAKKWKSSQGRGCARLPGEIVRRSGAFGLRLGVWWGFTLIRPRNNPDVLTSGKRPKSVHAPTHVRIRTHALFPFSPRSTLLSSRNQNTFVCFVRSVSYYNNNNNDNNSTEKKMQFHISKGGGRGK